MAFMTRQAAAEIATTPAGRPAGTDSATRTRTRGAILEAASRVLPENSSASLGEVAAAAQVGRSTLHRYFPDRADLIRALSRHMCDQMSDCFARVEPEVGEPVDVLRRVAEAFLDLGPVMTYLFREPLLADDTELWAAVDADTDPLRQVLDRAAPDLRPELSRSWIIRVFWSLVYNGWEAVREEGTPRPVVIDSVITTFCSGVMTRD